MAKAPAAKNQKAHCNTCEHETNHDLLHEEMTEWDDHDGLLWGGNSYEMLRCKGCDTIKLRHQSWFSEDAGPDGALRIQTTYYPPAVARSEPRWMGDFPTLENGHFHPIELLLKEIYAALHNNSRRLVAMGVRAVLEFMMVEKIGDRGSFEANIRAFREAGYLTEKQSEHFKAILEAGHAAMHRNFNPSVADLKTVLDLTENIIERTYIHEEQAQKLQKRIPERTPRPSKT